MKKQITKYVLLGFVYLFGGLAYGQVYDVVWENLSKATFSSNTLQRASGASGTAKATSENMLFGNNPSNRFLRNNGYMTYTSNTTNQSKKIGFSVTASEHTEITNTIDYGFVFQTNGKVKAFTPDESSALVNYSTSDQFWLERRDEEMIFRVGAAELLRVRIDPTETLMLRAELTSNNSTFSGVSVSFDTKRFVIDPIINNSAKTMKMQITGGQAPFEYNWEDGEILRYPDLTIKEKGFARGLHELRVKDDNGMEFDRSFLLGNDISWANFSNTSQSGTTLGKTTSSGWGSALSTTIIGNADYFWLQYMIDIQSADKAFGVAYTGASFSQYTHLQAGFMLLPQNQLQVIYQGNIVLTTEYNSRDALLISNDGKGLQWLVNGKPIYQQAAAFTSDLKVGGLLKDNASLSKVSIFNINHKPLLSAWDTQSLSGSVTANISSLTNSNSPYHYYISENPIPPLHDIYTYTRDTIFDDTTDIPDSLEFFQGSHLPTSTSYTFDGLQSGEYYVSVFDKEGLLLYGNKINVEPALVIYNNSNVSLNTNLLTSTANNAKTDLNYYINDELPESSIDFTVMNASEKYSMGLSDFSATTTAIQYGFFVNSKTVKFYVNGILESTKYSVKNNNILTLEKSGTTLYYKINGVVMKQTTLSGTYTLKTQFDIAKGGTTVGVDIKEPMVKFYKFTPVIDNAACGDEGRSVSFTLTKKPQQNGVIFSYTLTNLTGTEVYSGSVNSGSSIVPLTNLPFGVYHLTGSSNTNNPLISVNELIYVGIEAEFDPIHAYSLTPNSYSLLKNTTNPLSFAYALSLNTLKLDQTGWVSFTPVRSGNKNRSYFSFDEDYDAGSPNGTYVLINTPLGASNFEFQFYSSGILMFTKYFQVGTSITAQIKEHAIKFFANWSAVSPELSFEREGDIHIKALSNKIGNGFENILFSFNCSGNTIYARVEKTLTGVRYPAKYNKFYFSYFEEYNDLDDKLDYSVFSASTNEEVLNSTIQPLTATYGDNRKELDVTSLAVGAYILDVKNQKDEHFYLRFIKE